jgi:hypothetical protein
MMAFGRSTAQRYFPFQQGLQKSRSAATRYSVSHHLKEPAETQWLLVVFHFRW